MGWHFLTTHALVLIAIAGDPRQTMRSVAEKIGVSQRTVQSVIRDLVAEGFVTRVRIGRRNVYEVDRTRPMRHPTVRRHDISALLRALD